MLRNKLIIMSVMLALAFLSYRCGGGGGESSKGDQAVQSEDSQNSAARLSPGNAEEGKKYFAQTCAACHGPEGTGLPNLGKDLTTSTYVTEKSDEELLKFIDEGRLPTDSLNSTGVAMPPRGGNPALKDQQIMDIIAYVRSIHK